MSKHTHHICKNCGNQFTGNFCNHCGQSAHIHEINIHFIWHEIKHGLLHWDAGIAYTCKQLFTRPGHSIREFLEGKRVKHFSPIGLILLLAGAYSVIMITSGLDSSVLIKDSEELRSLSHVFNDWTAHHYAATQLLLIPFISLSSWLVFRKQGYHFLEHILLNTFIASQRLIIALCFLPIIILRQGEANMQWMIDINFLIGMLFTCWTYQQFFLKLRAWKAWVLGILAYLIWVILALLILVAVIEVYSWSHWHKFI